MKLSYCTLDVFTSTPFYGNPVAIVNVPASLLPTNLSQRKKQLIAREFNFSETVFLHEQAPSDAQDGVVKIDIFTPWAEINFAGHPTVGTTNYLLRYLKHENFRTLVTKAGRNPVSLSSGGESVALQVAHNVRIHHEPFQHPVHGGPFPVVSIVKGMSFILARMRDLEVLARQTKSFRENSYVLDGLDEGWSEGLIATYCYVDLGVDDGGTRRLRTRCLSMREDPATGSAASALCCFLALQAVGEEKKKKGTSQTKRFLVTQGVEMGRKSEIGVEVTVWAGESGWRIEKVVLSGTAVKVMEGSLEVSGG